MNRDQDCKNLIVLLGIDGSGKTTILMKLKEMGFCVSSWKLLDSTPNQALYGSSEFSTIQYIRGLPHGNYVDNLGPFSRAAFILSLIFAEYEFIIRPHLDAHRQVITDTYYIRPLAKELVRKKSSLTVIKSLTQLPHPRLVVYLRITPETAFYRKRGKVSQHEVVHEKTLSDFVSFQTSVDKMCKKLIKGMNIVSIDASKSVDEIVDQIVSLLEEIKCQRKMA